MNKELMSQYAKIKNDISVLEEQKKIVSEKILDELRSVEGEKFEDPEIGQFILCRKVSWKYTDAVTKIEDRLKIAKVKEQEKGIAEASETQYLTFKKNDPHNL